MKLLKQTIAIVALTIVAFSTNAQVKIGKEPTAVTTNTNLDIQAINGVSTAPTGHVVVTKDLGYLGVNVTDPKNDIHVFGKGIIGYSDIVNTGGFSLVTGDGHNNSCNSSIITGTGNVTAGSNSIVAGQVNNTLAGSKNNIVTGDNQSVAGTSNVVTGGRHVVTGTGNSNLIGGFSHTVSGVNNLVSGSTNSLNATNGFAVGIQNTIVAGHNESVVMGIGVTTTATGQFRANFTGGIFFNVAPTITSDFRKKKNVNTLSYGIAEVMKMRPTSYQYKDNTTNDTNLGFIAQEMVKIVPEVVAVPKNDKDFYAIRYEELIPVLTKAIQEQQAQIEAIKAENNELKVLVKALLVNKK
jgi:Chaperone of endosialidase